MDGNNKKKMTDIFNDLRDINDIKNDIQKIEYAYNNTDNKEKTKIINEIYQSYYWMSGAIALLPSSTPKSSNQMNTVDYQYILEIQHSFLMLYAEGKTIEFLDAK